MSRLLHVIANPKPEEESISRRLSAQFFHHRRLLRSEESMEVLDLYVEDVPLLDAMTADLLTNPARAVPSSAEELPPSWSLAASDRFTAQFLRADRLVITAPLWNFGPPAILKAWIDLIVRQGQTFAFTPEGIRPLAPGKKLLIIGSRGGVYSGDSPLKDYEFLDTYLRALFGFLGVESVESVWAEGTTYPNRPETIESLQRALRRVSELAESF